jgi:hypothetical protein
LRFTYSDAVGATARAEEEAGEVWLVHSSLSSGGLAVRTVSPILTALRGGKSSGVLSEQFAKVFSGASAGELADDLADVSADVATDVSTDVFTEAS